MPGILLIFRAFKLKKAADRLERAKENSLRIYKGQKPRYPWYEHCWIWIVDCLKKYLFKGFCPCFVKSHGQDYDFSKANCLRRFCLQGTFENFATKSFFGFIFGLILTTGIFFFLLHQLNINPRATTAICCVFGFFLTLGLAFNEQVRCITFLALPELFSSRGRIALMAYAYILVMSGPTKNAMRNANILVESMSCGQEIIITETKAIMKSIFAPLVAIFDAMRSILKALKDFARQMKEAFIAIRDLLMEIINAIKTMFGWLMSIVNICSTKYGSPYQRCNKAFDNAIEDCRKKMGVFDFLCYIVKAVKYVCEVARIVDLLCAIPKAIKTGIIQPLKDRIKEFARYMYDQFYVNVTLVHYYNYSLEQSKSFEEIRGDIAQEIRERTRWFTNLVDWSDLAMSFVLLILVFKAYLYRTRYLAADHFDNNYITIHMREIDDRRTCQDKETIFPLSFRERRKFIQTFSVRMAKSERRQLAVAATLLFVSGVQMGFCMLLDYSLYNFLIMIRFFGKLQSKAQGPSNTQIHVKGEGVMADMYREMITQFDPIMSNGPEFDSTRCLPNPIPINLDRYQQVGIMFALSFILALTESYGLRLRHVICGCYYPEREKLRAVWLYNHILKTRGGLSKFLRRKIRRNMYGDEKLEKISLLDRLSNQSKWFKKLLNMFGYNRIYCICCNEPGKEEDEDKFKRCITPGCKGIYCYACFDDINNQCTLCMKPVDYGDLSDISEERDSSEEELQDTQMEESDSGEEDFEYQYADRDYSCPDDITSVPPHRDIEAAKKIQLVKIEDFESDDEV